MITKIKHLLLLSLGLSAYINGNSQIAEAYYIKCDNSSLTCSCSSTGMHIDAQIGSTYYQSTVGSLTLLISAVGKPDMLNYTCNCGGMNFHYAHNGYAKGTYNYSGDGGTKFTCDDPVYISKGTINLDPSLTSTFTYGPFAIPTNQNPKFQYSLNTGDWFDISTISSTNNAGGALSFTPTSWITFSNCPVNVYFRIIKTLENGTITYGNTLTVTYLPNPTIKIVGPSVVCADQYISIQNACMGYPETYFEMKLDGQYAPWVSFYDTLKYYGTKKLYFSTIKWGIYGKEIPIRTYYHDAATNHNIYSNAVSTVFLPIPSMTFTPHDPTCHTRENGSFTLTFDNVPSDGIVGGTIPLNIRIKKYDLNPIAPVGFDYIPIDTLGKRFYYSTGVYIQLNVQGKSITIDNQLIQNSFPSQSSRFKLSAGIYNRYSHVPKKSNIYFK